MWEDELIWKTLAPNQRASFKVKKVMDILTRAELEEKDLEYIIGKVDRLVQYLFLQKIYINVEEVKLRS